MHNGVDIRPGQRLAQFAIILVAGPPGDPGKVFRYRQAAHIGDQPVEPVDITQGLAQLVRCREGFDLQPE